MSTMRHWMIQKRNVSVDRLRLLTEKTNFPLTDKLSLDTQIYRSYSDITDIKTLRNTGIIKFDQAKSEEEKAELAKVGDKFGESWTTHWFFVEFTIPEEWDKLAAEEDEFHFIWDSGCEATIYDYETGMYLQGLSTPRRYFYILDRNGPKKHKFAIEMACNGMFGNFSDGRGGLNPVDHHKTFTLNKCQIGLFRRNLWELKMDFDTIFDISEKMTNDNSQYGDLALGVGNQIADIIFTMDELTDEEVKEARVKAQEYLSVHNHSEVHKIYAVGHCHIDTAWLWPFRETRRKWGRSWSSQLKLMELFPTFNFWASSAQQYEFVKDDYPELFQRIKDKVNEGRFEVVGGSWVEFDGNIPSGESMIRQFLYGQKFFKEHFGSYSNVFFMPDTFGYSAQLPQIMKESGINRFVTQKLSWSRFNKFPHNTFIWNGLDGSDVLAHFPPADTYNSNGKLDDILKSQNNFKDKGVTNHSLLLFGEGDGGGGPERSHIDSILRFKDLQGVPNVKLSTVNEFFNELEKEKADLYNWRGELYLEIHNGTYTTMAHNKRCNRKMEFLLKDAEFLSTIASLHSKEFNDPKGEFDKMWKLVLLDQFHDVIPGTWIGMVYEDTKEHYDYWLKSSQKIIDEFASDLFKEFVTPKLTGALQRYNINESFEEAKHGSKFIAYNNENFDRNEYVSLLVDDKIHYGFINVPQHGYKVFSVDELCTESDLHSCIKLTETENNFEILNDFYSVTINKTGRISSYKDKTFFSLRPQEIVDANVGEINRLHIHNDIPDFWDAWDIFDWSRYTHKDVLADTEKSTIIVNNSACIAIKFEYQISAKSKMIQTVYFYANNQRIDFKTRVDWHENRKLLRTYFPVNVLSDYVTFDIQNGILKRTTANNTLWDQAQYEVCGHKYVDISEGSYGVALLSESKYGYACKGNTLGMSLLRSPKWPNETADMGEHEFTYSFYFHYGDKSLKDVQNESFIINSPLKLYSLDSNTEIEQNKEFSFIKIDQSNVVLDALKVGEHGQGEYIIRVHESLGLTTFANINVNFWKLETVIETNTLEEKRDGDCFNDKNESLISFNESNIFIKLRPFKILTNTNTNNN